MSEVVVFITAPEEGTAWMAFYCGAMLSMSLELARENPATEDMASKFFEHFVAITDAINSQGGTGLWSEEDGFFYDQLSVDGRTIPLRIRSLVGLLPLIAVEVLEDEVIERTPGFKKRLDWFLKNRPDLADLICYMCTLERGGTCRHLLAIPSEPRLRRILAYLLDEREFLSPYGIRSLSKYHAEHPFVFDLNDQEFRVGYVMRCRSLAWRGLYQRRSPGQGKRYRVSTRAEGACALPCNPGVTDSMAVTFIGSQTEG